MYIYLFTYLQNILNLSIFGQAVTAIVHFFCPINPTAIEILEYFIQNYKKLPLHSLGNSASHILKVNRKLQDFKFINLKINL